MTKRYPLTLTYCDEKHNEFGEICAASWHTRREQILAFDSIPVVTDSLFMVEKRAPNDDIQEEKQVSLETAKFLAGTFWPGDL